MFFGRVKNTEEWGFDVFNTTFDTYIEMDDDEREKLIEKANKKKKIITGDKDGNPILVDPPKPNEEEIAKDKIKELELYLRSTDWYAIRFADTGEPIPSDIKQKRQEAREEISKLKE